MTKQRLILPNDGRPPMPMPAFSNAPRSVAPAGRRLVHLAVDLIDSHPLAPREIYTERMIRERADDLRAQGQHDPIHVIPNPDTPGRYIICDGWTRVQACRVHGALDTLLAEIHEGLSLREAAWFGYEQNEGREQQSDYDRAMFHEKLLADGETAEELARRGGFHKSMMTFLRAYAKLPAGVLDLVRAHPQKFGSRVAYELHRLHEACGEAAALELATEFATHPDDLPVRWLLDRVRELRAQTREAAPAEKKAAPAWPAHQVYDSAEARGYYRRRDGRIQLSLQLAPQHREAFAQGLEQLLKTLGEPASGDPV